MRAGTPLVLVLLSVVPAAAQQTPPRVHTWWASVGAGFGWLEEAGDLGVHAAVSVQSGPNVITARAATATGVLRDLFGLWGDADAVSDLGILYGRGSTRGPVRGSVGIGLGVAEVRHSVDPSSRSNTRHLTVPLEAQIAWRPIPVLGVGLYGFASFNGEHSFGGLSFMIQAGRVR